MPPPVTIWEVRERLAFAWRRLRELSELHGGRISEAPAAERQILLQEFFFHVVGAIEVVGQMLNRVERVGIEADDLTIPRLVRSLPEGQHRQAVAALHAVTRGRYLVLPHDSDDGRLFRIYVYRNLVTHHRPGPFFYRRGQVPDVSLLIDPRYPQVGASPHSAVSDLEAMHRVVSRRIRLVVDTFPQGG